MINKIFLTITFLFSAMILSQNYDDQDIFVQNKEGYLILKSSVEKDIRTKIEPIVNKKLEQMVKNPKDKRSKVGEDQIEFAKDTLTINQYLDEYSNYAVSGTTLGMNQGIQIQKTEYDRLLNKYYKKDLEILQPDMKKQLIASQKKWLDYYLNETPFINNLQNFGNQSFIIYASEYYLKILVDRVQFLADIYEGKMQGTSTYKEN